MQKGFTLIELIVVIAIIAVLSGIILFSITQYINKGKDSNIAGNLAVLIPAGEVYYNGNGNSYQNFCDPTKTSVVNNAILQMPVKPDNQNVCGNNVGFCCGEDSDHNYQSWAACVQEFTNNKYAYCVDSRGIKKEIDTAVHPCDNNITQCP